MSYETEDVKHCPFCGRTLITVETCSESRFSAHCSCGATGPDEYSERNAKKAWNARDRYHFWNPFRFSVHFPKYSSSKAFTGSLEAMDIGGILGILVSRRKTGVLQLVRKKTRIVICLKDGNIVAASDNVGLMKLGQILHNNGMISRERLQEALNLARESDKRLGEVLIFMRYIDPNTLKDGVRQQIQEALLEIVFWEEGNFEFRDCTVKFDEEGITGLHAMEMCEIPAIERLTKSGSYA